MFKSIQYAFMMAQYKYLQARGRPVSAENVLIDYVVKDAKEVARQALGRQAKGEFRTFDVEYRTPFEDKEHRVQNEIRRQLEEARKECLAHNIRMHASTGYETEPVSRRRFEGVFINFKQLKEDAAPV